MPPVRRQPDPPPPPRSPAAVIATAAAPTAAAAVAPVVGGAVLTYTQATALKETVLAAIQAVNVMRMRDSGPWIFAVLHDEYPAQPASLLNEVIAREQDYEAEFQRKQLERLERDLAKIVAISDPKLRQEALESILEREKRYSLAREQAMLERAMGDVEVEMLKTLSPDGALWKLSEHVREHTLDCLAMGEKFWPWSILADYHPPLHHGCPCYLLGLDEAIEMGEMTADQVPDPAAAERLYGQLMRDIGLLGESVTVEDIAEHLGWAGEQALEEAAVNDLAMVALYPKPELAKVLALKGGEPPEQLHVTLGFLGEALRIKNPARLKDAVRGWAASTPPLKGEISGHGLFTAGEKPVTYASVDLPGLPESRQQLVDVLKGAGSPPSTEHGFTPHITLTYEDAPVKVPNRALRFDEVRLVIGDEQFRFPLAGDELEEARGRRAAAAHAPARWEKGFVKGGQFKGARGSARVALKSVLPHPPASPLRARARGDGRWAWVAGKYRKIPLADAWIFKAGPHQYTSPPGSTELRRNGVLIDGPGVAPDRAERVPRPAAPRQDAPRIHELAQELRVGRRSQAVQKATDAALRPRPGRVPISVGDGSEALLALRQAGFFMSKLSPRRGPGAKLEYKHMDTGQRLQVVYDKDRVLGVDWDDIPAPQLDPQRAQGPPKSWEEHQADAHAWAEELGDRFGAAVDLAAFEVEPEMSDHAGLHYFDGLVLVGGDTQPDIDQAGRSRAAGRKLTPVEAQGVWSSFWVTAHEIGHSVNPIDPLLWKGAHANLEEALNEESAHILAAERLTEQGQFDVLDWRRDFPDAIAVRGSYLHERHLLGDLLDQAGITEAFARREFVLNLKFRSDPSRRFEELGEALHKADPSRTATGWAFFAGEAFEHPPATSDPRPALAFQVKSPGRAQVGKFSYGRFAGADLSDDGTVLTMPNGAVRRIEKLPFTDAMKDAGIEAGSDGTAITHYPPGEPATSGLYYADGSPKSFRYIDSQARAKLIMRAFIGKGSPGAQASPGSGSGWDEWAKWLADEVEKKKQPKPPETLFDAPSVSKDASKGASTKPKKWEPKPKGPPPPPIPPLVVGGVNGEPKLTVDRKPGGGMARAKDEEGKTWFFNDMGGNPDAVAGALLANRIYDSAGVRVPELKTVTMKTPDFAAIPDRKIKGDTPVESKYKTVSTGVILVEPDGSLWIYEPRNHFGGYEHTFPKGGLESGLTQQQNAHKELWEETGLHGRITGIVGDFEGDTTMTRYYVGVKTGGEPTIGPETQAVKRVSPEEAAKLLNKDRDKEILAELETVKLPSPKTMKGYKDEFPADIDTPVLVTPAAGGSKTAPKGGWASVADDYMLDALLGNWGFTDISWDGDEPVRVNQSDVLGFRGSSRKPYGPVPTEVWTLMSPKGKGFGKIVMDEDEMRERAGALVERMDSAGLDDLIDAASFADAGLREDIRGALHARLAWMGRFAAGEEDLPGPLEGDEALDSLAERQESLKLLPKEVDAVTAFAADPMRINTPLRKAEKNPEISSDVKALDGLFDYAKKTDEDMFVYSALDLAPERVESEDLGGLVGQTFQEKAYLPTAVDPADAGGHAAIMRITVPMGSHALAIHELGMDDLPPQPEVVLRRNQKFRIVGRRIDPEDGQLYVDVVALPYEKPKPNYSYPKPGKSSSKPYKKMSEYGKAAKGKGQGGPTSWAAWSPGDKAHEYIYGEWSLYQTKDNKWSLRRNGVAKGVFDTSFLAMQAVEKAENEAK